MRIWLKDSERRPDPEPARADGRKAVLAGTVLWLLGLAAALIWSDALVAAGTAWMIWMCLIGVFLGVAGFVVVQLRRRD